MAPKIITLDRFLVQQQSRHPGTTGELARVITQMGLVGKIISGYMRRAALEGLLGLTGRENVQGEEVKKLDELGNQVFVRAFGYVDIVGALVSEELEKPVTLSSQDHPGKYIVLVDPVDGSSNLDVNGTIGSIFSVREVTGTIEESILGKGAEQVAAGYVMYGPSTYFVYTTGDGVNSFVLDERIGEFVLDREGLTMPEQGRIFCANFGNYDKWAGRAKGFIDALIREKGHSMRYTGALVADLHQILQRGGIYFYPEDEKRPEGKLRLLYECAPVAMIAEQAGGAATTGKTRVMDFHPESFHQRVPFAAGSRREVEQYEKACRGE
ncbi:MAG: class 1 fructose-bisphosphatase [Candidatus Sulfobium sp.]|jgi:fructose-1,6-bisphosphatase I